MNTKSVVNDVTAGAPNRTTKGDSAGRIAVLAVLVVLLVSAGAISGYYEGHTSDTTATVAIPWSLR